MAYTIDQGYKIMLRKNLFRWFFRTDAGRAWADAELERRRAALVSLATHSPTAVGRFLAGLPEHAQFVHFGESPLLQAVRAAVAGDQLAQALRANDALFCVYSDELVDAGEGALASGWWERHGAEVKREARRLRKVQEVMAT